MRVPIRDTFMHQITSALLRFYYFLFIFILFFDKRMLTSSPGPGERCVHDHGSHVSRLVRMGEDYHDVV